MGEDGSEGAEGGFCLGGRGWGVRVRLGLGGGVKGGGGGDAVGWCGWWVA